MKNTTAMVIILMMLNPFNSSAQSLKEINLNPNFKLNEKLKELYPSMECNFEHAKSIAFKQQLSGIAFEKSKLDYENKQEGMVEEFIFYKDGTYYYRQEYLMAFGFSEERGYWEIGNIGAHQILFLQGISLVDTSLIKDELLNFVEISLDEEGNFSLDEGMTYYKSVYKIKEVLVDFNLREHLNALELNFKFDFEDERSLVLANEIRTKKFQNKRTNEVLGDVVESFTFLEDGTYLHDLQYSAIEKRLPVLIGYWEVCNLMGQQSLLLQEIDYDSDEAVKTFSAKQIEIDADGNLVIVNKEKIIYELKF